MRITLYFAGHLKIGGGGFTRHIPRDKGADQARGVTLIGKTPRMWPKVPDREGEAKSHVRARFDGERNQ